MTAPTGFLAIPAEPPSQTAQLIRKVRLLAVRRLLRQPAAGLGAELGPAVRQLQGRLAGLLREHADLVLEVIGGPDVLVPLLALESGAAPAGEVLRDVGPRIVAGLGERAPALDVLWEAPFDTLVVGRRRWRGQTAARAIRCAGRGPELRGADGHWRRLDGAEARGGGSWDAAALPLAPAALPSADLALVDTNPLAMLEEHPEKAGNALSLGDREAAAWQAGYEPALRLVRHALPSLLPELAYTLRRLVPVGWEPQRHFSASYREGPGVVYATLHPDSLTLAEAVIHETQHGKLNLLRWFDPVLANGATCWTPSPVRPDLRPLVGVLLAVHAFVPVAAMYRRLAEQGHALSKTPRFGQRYGEIVAANGRGLETVQRLGEPTAVGARVVEALEALHAWAADGAPAAPTSEAMPG